MRFTALLATALLACTSNPTYGNLVASKLASGTGTIAVTGTATAFSATGFTWKTSSPTLSGQASFQITIDSTAGTGGNLDCDPLPWSSLSTATPTPIASLACSIDFLLPTATDFADYRTDLTAGMITMSSSLDHNGDGSVTLQLDASQSIVATTTTSTAQPSIELAVSLVGLTGTAAFAESDPTGNGDGCEICGI